MKSFSLYYLVFFTILVNSIGISYAGESLLVKHQQNSAQLPTTAPVPETLSSPRQTMRTFITAMDAVAAGNDQQIVQAISTLDLSEINSLIRASKGKELAETLQAIINYSGGVALADINSDPKKDRYLFAHYRQGVVEIVKQADGSWLFSGKTLAGLPAILEGILAMPTQYAVENSPQLVPLSIQLIAMIPQSLKGGFLLAYWQWLALLLIIVVGSAADKFLGWLLAKNVLRWKHKNQGFQELDNEVLRPLGLMAMALIWWLSLDLLALPDTALVILLIAVKLLVSLSGVWSAFRLVDVLYVLLMEKARATANRFDDLLIPMLRRSLKVLVVVIGIIFVADNLNVDVTSLLAGLGLGGLAFALAAKDLLGNFFGSITILLDRPFNIGDWVNVDNVEGKVIDVGFRTTKIKTFYDSVITLPNAVLTNTTIDNMGKRRYRRMKTMLGLTYQTPPEKIEAFCEGIRTLVQLHPYMRKDYYQVYFNQYSAASLDILVYVFWQTPDWNTELRERHRFLVDILRLAKQLDIEFAYPTQTLYVKQEAESETQLAESFQPAMTELAAQAMGSKQAQAIVDATLGRDVKPAPVQFPKN